MATEYEVFELDGHEIKLSNPGTVYFPQSGWTKGDLARYHVDCADALLVQLRERPCMLKRFPGGIETKPIYQKRVPAKRPEWLQTAVLKFPSGREAEELVPVDAAHLLWAVSLGNVDWNPHPVRRSDLDHPDELRVDIDPMPEAPWDHVRRVALLAGEVLRGTAWSASRAPRARAGCTSWSASTSGGTSRPCARPRSRSRARSNGAARGWRPRSGSGRSARPARCSSTTTRTPRTTRWRRATRSARCRTRAWPATWRGTRCPTASSATSASTPSRSGCGPSGDPSAGIDATAASLDSLLDLAHAQPAT